MKIEIILAALVGAVIFGAGYATCFFSAKKQAVNKPEQEHYVEKRRVLPSLRNPLRTYDVRYDKYKTKDSQLYAPVKPKPIRANEVDTDEI